MIITITGVAPLTYNQQITGRIVEDKSGKTHNIKKGKKGSDLQENFEEKWVWLDGNVGKAIDLEMGTFTDKDGVGHPFVADFTIVADSLQPEVEPATPPEHKDTEKPTPSGQEVGLWWKELGIRIGDGSLERDFPKSHVKIKGQYYAQMQGVLNINMKGE